MNQLYFILLFSVSNLFAQKIPWKTNLKLSPDTKYIHVIDPYNGKNDEYFFDKKGKLEKVISISDLIIDYKEVYRSQFYYNDSLLIKRENFYNDKLRDITKYEYENGNLILETEFDVEENFMTSQISYCYLEGKLSSKLKVEKDGIDITEIEYNDRGSVIKLSEYFGEDDLQREVITTKNNNVEVEEIYNKPCSKYVSKQTKKFVYNDDKKILEFHYDDYQDAKGRHVYTYNNNVLANAKYYDEKDRLWMEEFYDDKGYIVKEVRPDLAFQTAQTTLFENYYNKRGDLIKSKRYMGRVRIAKFKIKYW